MKTLEIKLFTRTLNKDQFRTICNREKKRLETHNRKAALCKPKSYRILTPRTVRLARGEFSTARSRIRDRYELAFLEEA